MSDKHRTIIGLDPGISTGVAIFLDGKLSELSTVRPWCIPDLIKSSRASRVVFEDSRLQSHVWITGCTHAATVKMARNLGQIDAWCALIVVSCDDAGITAHGISPKGKGAKLGADAFKRLTGWDGPSNEHTRDAAMVAYPYRGAV